MRRLVNGSGHYVHFAMPRPILDPLSRTYAITTLDLWTNCDYLGPGHKSCKEFAAAVLWSENSVLALEGRGRS